MSGETFDSVFDALADTPAEAANMTARADLLLAIRERVKAWQAQGGLTQEEAAARLGLTRPRLNDLMRGKLDKFSLDALVNIDLDLNPGEHLRLTVAAKGFGAENMSRVRVLTPANRLENLKREVVSVVQDAGPNACPPVVVGVGLGGTLEMAALLAKKALMRAVGQRHPELRHNPRRKRR